MSVIIFDPYAKADEHDLPSDFRDAVANFKLNYKIRPLQIQNMREIVGDLIAAAAIFDTKCVVKHIMRVQNYLGRLRLPGGCTRVAFGGKYLARDQSHIGCAQRSPSAID
jgi:hypothetical protein